MSSPIIKNVNMIILMQPDVEAAVAFYKDLGLKLIFAFPKKWAEFQVGTIKLGLCPTSDSPEEIRRTGVVFEVENLKELYLSLKDKVNFVREPFEAIHGIMATFKDPGNNLIDFYQPTPEKGARSNREGQKREPRGRGNWLLQTKKRRSQRML